MEMLTFLDQVRKTMAMETCLTSEPVHMFPLAHHWLRDGSLNFKTAMTHKGTNLIGLPEYHIAVTIEVDTVTISMNESLSSSKHDRGILECLGGQFQTVMAQLQKAMPGSTISMINLMSPIDWQDAAVHDLPFPTVNSTTIHSMMQQNSLPSCLAIDAWDGRLTYAELDEWSNVVAHKLRHAGVRRGTYVPLFFEKSMWHPVSVFACSKLGAPWVTIPHDMPPGRVQSIISQLRDEHGQTSRVCLSSLGQRENAASYVQDVIEVTSDMDRVTNGDLGSNGITHQPECAYVCFTSGTTGTPKGIAISQENICAFIPAWIKLRGYPGGVGIREGHILPYTGDMSVLEILVSLCTGSCLCILSEDERMNDLGPALERYRVTNLHITPSISEILDPAELPSLKHIHFGGELMTRFLMERWLPKVEVLVTYGPAEITNECSGMRVLNAAEFRNGCIGRPFGARMYIVAPDNPHKLLPKGFVGEIIVEGPGVSAGYIPQQNSEAFVEGLAWAPASHDRRRRFYRTGDLGYRDADGLFYCAGRKDLQVKIRGQRIEISEVEEVIRAAMPEGTRVVVDAILLRTGTQSLVAFLQLGNGSFSANQDMLVETLKAHLVTHLPRAFIPSSFMFVDHIPLGTTGKADRKALKAMAEADLSKLAADGISSTTSSSQNGSDAPDQAPHMADVKEPNPEEVLQPLWASILHLDVDKIHPESHFFRLGGDSIGAMKMVSLARKQSLFLSFTQVYRTPTLKALAAVAKRPKKLPPAVLPASQSSSERPAVAPFPTKPLQAYVHKETPSLPNGNASEHSSSLGGALKTSESPRLERPVNGLSKSEPKKAIVTNGVSMNGVPSRYEIAELWNIDAESIEDVFNCTPIQESLFALSRIIPGVQVLQWEFEIPNNVSIQRVCNAWRRVVDRNPILRTRFFQSKKSLFQIVLADDFHWEVQHEAISDEARLRLREGMMKNDARLSNFAVFQVPNDSMQALVWTVHHALVDYHSARLFMKAAQKGYKGHVIPHLEPITTLLPHSQVNTMTADEVSYWKRVLGGSQSVFFPSISRLRDGANASAGLGQIKRKLRSAVTKHDSAAVLRAAWVLTIAKMTQSDDVLFGALIGSRADAKSRNVAGSLSNILPVRTKVNRAITIDQFLKQVHQEMIALAPCERSSISKIADIDPDFQRACGFQSILNVHVSQTEADDSCLSGLSWMTPVDKPYWGSSNTLAVDCSVRPSEIELAIRYERSVSEEAVCEVLACFSELVEALIAAAPETALQDITKTAESNRVTGHIETCLRSYLNLDEDCAVCVLKPQRASSMLIAFLKVDENMTESAFTSKVASIQNELKGKLPPHEIPSAFYRMPNGPEPEKPAIPNGTTHSPAFPPWVLGQLDVDASYIQDVTTATPFQTEIVGGMVQVPGTGTFVRRYPVLAEMDIDRLSKAWDLVCAKLPCMRTRVILGPEHQSARLVTLSTWAKMDVNSFNTPSAAEAGINGIRVEAGTVGRPLARAAVIHIEGHQSVFIYAMNHTIYDRDTLDVVWNALCDAYWSGRVPQTLLPYRRLAEYFDTVDPEPARAFWRAYMKDAPATVFPTNPTPDYVARPASAQGRLIPLVREGGSAITTGTLARTAWGLTIGSYTGSNDVVFRGILSGRTVSVEEIEHVAGPTLTNVPIRIRITDPSMPVPSFLAKIQEEGVDIVEHETLGLAAIAGLSPEAGRVCGSFNNMLVVHPAEAESGAQAMPLGEESMIIDLTGYVALTLTCSLSATAVVASTIHDPKVLDDKAAQGVLARFQDCLIALAEADRRVDFTVGDLLQSLSERSKSPCA